MRSSIKISNMKIASNLVRASNKKSSANRRLWLWLCACMPVGSPFRAQGVKPTLLRYHPQIGDPITWVTVFQMKTTCRIPTPCLHFCMAYWGVVVNNLRLTPLFHASRNRKNKTITSVALYLLQLPRCKVSALSFILAHSVERKWFQGTWISKNGERRKTCFGKI